MYKLAKKRVPKMFFEYADTGSWTSSTYKRNDNDFKSISFEDSHIRLKVDPTQTSKIAVNA